MIINRDFHNQRIHIAAAQELICNFIIFYVIIQPLCYCWLLVIKEVPSQL